MKVSELMDPAGVRLYANIKEAADVLGILVELQEETGATADHWLPMGQLIASPGCYDEVLHLYLARGLTFGDTHPDEDEFLSVRRIPFQELVQRCLSGEIQDGKTVTAVLKAKLLLGL